MFSHIMKKLWPIKNRPILLGDIYVNGRSDFKRFLEFNSNGENSPEDLKQWIKELLEIPILYEHKNIPNDCLILDVAVRKYQAGTDAGLYINQFIPIIWRPSIKLEVRLRDFNTGKTLREHTTKKIMGWGEFFNRLFSLKSIFKMSNTFDSNDLKILLAKALMESLLWAKKETKS